MRFKLKEKEKTNGVRTINKFALLPICTENEVRWLERVEVEQVLVEDCKFDYNGIIHKEKRWINKRFIN